MVDEKTLEMLMAQQEAARLYHQKNESIAQHTLEGAKIIQAQQEVLKKLKEQGEEL